MFLPEIGIWGAQTILGGGRNINTNKSVGGVYAYALVGVTYREERRFATNELFQSVFTLVRTSIKAIHEWVWQAIGMGVES